MRILLMVTTLIAALAITCASASSYAGSYASSYITVEGTSVSVEDSLDEELNPMGLRFRLGSPVGHNVDIEAHFGFAGDSRNSYGELDTSYAGVFLKGYVPIGFNSAFYALGGYSLVALTQTVDRRELSDERHGFSYGG